MALHITCIRCGKAIGIRPEDRGTTVECPFCHAHVGVARIAPPVGTVAKKAGIPALICVVVIVALGIVYVAKRNTKQVASSAAADATATTFTGLAELKAQAESAALAGNLAESHKKYRELQDVAARNVIN